MDTHVCIHISYHIYLYKKNTLMNYTLTEVTLFWSKGLQCTLRHMADPI